MISETIAFETLSGEPITEEFHFSISESEAAEMAMRHHVKGGSELLEYFQTISDAEDGNAMMDAFMNMIRKSIGFKHENNIQFVKTQDYTDRFMQSDAYNRLFLRLLREPEYAQRFLNGILPANIQKKIAEESTKERVYTTQELLDMSEEKFFKAVGTDEKNWSPATLLVAYQRKSNRAA
jgi:hypothetical protein